MKPEEIINRYETDWRAVCNALNTSPDSPLKTILAKIKRLQEMAHNHAQATASMTDEQIDRMIAAREKLTNVRDEQIDLVTVDAIDAMLRDVPAGQNNQIDLILGRLCAVLPKRVVMVQHIDGAQEVVPEFATAETIDQSRRDWNAIKGDLDI